jgi:RNA-directed DNA polymerase
MNTKLDRIAEKARTQRKLRFTSLAHLLTPDFLRETWAKMNRKGASGVDQETTEEFERNLEQRCQDIVARLKARRYKAPPVRRVEIPKGDGKTRPLGIPTVEDRLVQRAVARLLEPIYEADFLNCSFGFRPGRNAHQALTALRTQFMTGGVTTIFETDIRGYFDNINHQWLMRMLKLRIADPIILRLIGKWLRAGVMINGVVVRTEGGSPQGGPISPLLANIYLHYALDLWVQGVIAKKCVGRVYLTRFADDFVVAFAEPGDAFKFSMVIEKRLGKFQLEAAPEKTRLLTFGRTAATRGHKLGSFDFVGFTHVGGYDKKGRFAVVRLPRQKSIRKFLDAVKQKLTKLMHQRPRLHQKVLNQMLRGFYQYFGLHHCMARLSKLRYEVHRRWLWTLQRRSQRHNLTWESLARKPWFQLVPPRVVHPTV